MIAVAIMGCVFGILGIFTLGVVFVPLAALCAVVSFLGGITTLRFSAVFLGLVAGVLTCWGYFLSPSLWLLTGAAFVAASPPQVHSPQVGQPVEREVTTEGVLLHLTYPSGEQARSPYPSPAACDLARRAFRDTGTKAICEPMQVVLRATFPDGNTIIHNYPSAADCEAARAIYLTPPGAAKAAECH